MNDTTSTGDLPELTDSAVSRIEAAVFEEIASERPLLSTKIGERAHSRRRGWLTAAGIAAAFVVGVLVTPPILNSVGGVATSTADGGGVYVSGTAEDSSVGSPERSAPDAAAGSADSAESAAIVPGATDGTGREIIATAYATVQVEDIPEAAKEISALADSVDRYVESTEIGRSQTLDASSEPAPVESDYGYISIRVPSADLAAVISRLEESGEVLSSSISKQDVTSTAIDLRARVDATKASVQRLTELMSQSGSVSELIEAEVALTDRQAQLESYEQQLASLEDQVAMSSLQVQLTRANAPTTADPAGFGDGLLAGWNGLVVSLNALVIAVGFILPWIALAGLVVLVVWLIRRARRTRRERSREVAAGSAED